MANKISVSVMCSDLMNLEQDIKLLEQNEGGGKLAPCRYNGWALCA